MAKFWFLFLVFPVFGLLSGCQESQTIPGKLVIADGNSAKFPAIMVGVWETPVDASGDKWGIKFEKDGSIRKIIHSVAGPMEVEEGGIYKEGPEKDTFMYFILGPCTSEYDPKTKILKVKIVIEDYEMKLPTGDLRGRIEDDFEGLISSDGVIWKVKWWDYGHLEGARTPPPEEIKAHPDELVFTRVDTPEPKKTHH